MEKIANFVCDKAKFIILIVVVLNLTSLASFARFGFDTDFLTFFSGDNPKAVEFDHLNEKYNSGDTISILVEQDRSLLDKENLEEVYEAEHVEMDDPVDASELQRKYIVASDERLQAQREWELNSCQMLYQIAVCVPGMCHSS